MLQGVAFWSRKDLGANIKVCTTTLLLVTGLRFKIQEPTRRSNHGEYIHLCMLFSSEIAGILNEGSIFSLKFRLFTGGRAEGEEGGG